MSANIGRMMYTGQVPWHGLGKHVEKALTWAEAINEAGLNWQVAKSPVQFTPKSLGEVAKVFEGRSVTYRVDTGAPLGIVSDGFPVIQNEQAGKVLDQVVGEVGAHYHTAGYLGEGQKVWMLIKLPGILRVVGDDVVEKYLLAANGHDGSLSFWIMETPIRVVCQNTLMAAIGQKNDKAFRAVHSAGLVLDVTAIREKLGYAAEKFNVLEQAYQKMAKTVIRSSLSDQASPTEFFKRVIEYPELTKVAVVGEVPYKYEDEASTRMKNRLNDLLELFETGKGSDLPGVKGTVWGAYNAVTEYADYFNGKSNAGRAQSTLFGAGAQLKTRAFDEALALVK